MFSINILFLRTLIINLTFYVFVHLPVCVCVYLYDNNESAYFKFKNIIII